MTADAGPGRRHCAGTAAAADDGPGVLGESSTVDLLRHIFRFRAPSGVAPAAGGAAPAAGNNG
ncbi:hypothetical protein U5640_43725 [Streptomyces sp. SS7]|uniref:hypothetical protein n=1 Tax=Streptomyces sp. SS7 TaxID=3108485 RepID=UPI0030EB3C40